MKIRQKITIFILMFIIVGIGYVPKVSAAVQFSDIKVTEIRDGYATIIWKTDARTRGMIYYGEKADELNMEMGYSLYDSYHEMAITGLKKDKDYYFKIIALDESGGETESFIQYFSTSEMTGGGDKISPVIKDLKILDVTSTAVAISWTTDKKTNAYIYYREASEESYRPRIDYGAIDYYHEQVITGLIPEKNYYIKIWADDILENFAEGYLYFNTPSGETPLLRIFDKAPLSYKADLVFPTSVILKCKTNRVAKNSVSYGTDINNLATVVNEISFFGTLNHEIRLSNLEPETNYYYQMSATDYFSNTVSTEILSFRTSSPRIKIPSGTIVVGSGYKVYVIDGSAKRWIQTADIFSGLGYKWSWIQKMNDYVLDDYKEGIPITSANIHPNGTLIKYSGSPTVYLLENGNKRPISSATSFVKMGFDWSKIITLSAAETYETGDYL